MGVIRTNRYPFSSLERFYNVKVHSGYNISTVVISPCVMHPYLH